MWTPSAPTVGVPPNPSRLLALGSRNSTSRFPRFATSATDPGLFRRELMSSSACSVAAKSSAATRLAAISSLFQRGNPSLSSYKHRFKRQSFTCTRYGGCKRRARVQNTYVRIRVVVVSERFSESPQSRVQRTPNRSRNAHTTPSHHIFDVHRRDPSETPE